MSGGGRERAEFKVRWRGGDEFKSASDQYGLIIHSFFGWCALYVAAEEAEVAKKSWASDNRVGHRSPLFCWIALPPSWGPADSPWTSRSLPTSLHTVDLLSHTLKCSLLLHTFQICFSPHSFFLSSFSWMHLTGFCWEFGRHFGGQPATVLTVICGRWSTFWATWREPGRQPPWLILTDLYTCQMAKKLT